MSFSRSLAPCAFLALAATASAAPPDLLVSGYNTDTVLRFTTTGSHLGQLGAIGDAPGAQSISYASDGSILVAAEKIHRVLRFDPATGALIGPLVYDDPATPGDETGGLNGPTAAIEGADGKLYVASFNTDDVKRYDAATGAFLGVFVAPGSGGLNGPDAGMIFGPDGHLYVPSFFSNRVLKYDAATGAFLGVFAGGLGVPLSRPRVIRFRGDGVAYVTSWGNGRVLRFAPSGALLDTFATTATPVGLLLDPDSGDVFTSSDNANHVLRFDGGNKAALGTVIPAGTAGLAGANFLELLPDRALRLSRPMPGTAGVDNTISLSGATPHASILLLLGTSSASTPAGPCAKKWIGVAMPFIFPLVADAAGKIVLTGSASGVPAGTTIALQAVELSTCRVSDLVLETF